MAVKIRLTRLGAKKRPFYRLIAAHNEAKRDGRFLEVLGTYDPIREPAQVKLKEDRIKYWMEQGATPTETVRNLLKKNSTVLNSK
ncbi:MAG: 30S ribosomal protein S16 [Desulfobacterales bacterium]|nr:30S ribosomal protein S16 [Desulfobacterales bacterium]